MKKFLLASVALLTLTGAASAADLAARPYTKAPMMPPVAQSWTGFYIFGGAGGGLWDTDSHTTRTIGGISTSTLDQRLGGDGWFGTVGLGYDWQFNNTWVAGVFADGQFGSLRGTVQDQFAAYSGRIKNEDSWAAGVRLGYLVAPNVLSYVNAGYSGSHWSGTTLTSWFTGAASGFHTNSFNRNGWFIGGGVENNLNIFGISAPGWFMKTEYRAAYLRQQGSRLSASTAPTPSRSRHRQLQAVGPDHQHLAGLPLQLDRPGGRQVLIFVTSDGRKAPALPGLFVCAPAIRALCHTALAIAAGCRYAQALKQQAGTAGGDTEDDAMRRFLLIAGLLLLVVGLLWIGQGTGAIAWPRDELHDQPAAMGGIRHRRRRARAGDDLARQQWLNRNWE